MGNRRVHGLQATDNIYDNGNIRLLELYSKLYDKVMDWADENLTGNNAAYF